MLDRAQWIARGALEEKPLRPKFSDRHFLVPDKILQELIEDAAEAPHVLCLVTLRLHKRNLWRPVPPGADVYRYRPFLGIPLSLRFLQLTRDVRCLIVFTYIDLVLMLLEELISHMHRIRAFGTHVI